MSFRHFPQELVDIIIDNLNDDIPSLKSCSVAARTFVTSARIHIFNTLEISSPDTCQKLHRLLASSPHIPPLVHALCIELVSAEKTGGVYLEDRHVPWIMAGRTLSLVLPLLDLKRISLVENSTWDGNSQGRFSMAWNKLGRQLRSTLVDAFSSSKLESVHLRGIVVESPRQLLSLFSEATSLKEMSLSRVYFTMGPHLHDPWPESHPWRPKLRSLLLSELSSDSFGQHLINPCIDLTQVRSLALETDSSEWREKLIHTTNNNVEHLRLGYIEDPLRWGHTLGANLRSIQISGFSIFSLMDSVFKSCHDTRLESIIFDGYPSDVGMWDSPSLDATIELAVVHLRCLKMVEVRALVSSSRASFLLWSDKVRSALPSLVRRDMLQVTNLELPTHGPRHGWE
ncbi:hypothetical protein B0H19DRAFT_1097971 [Mycena capillaripes]|nr:hypothetical protein B0H19DRAFT_1097971 [Mycena capillaripes]